MTVLTRPQEAALSRLVLIVNVIVGRHHTSMGAEELGDYNEALAACYDAGIPHSTINAYTTSPAPSDLRPPQPGSGGGGSSSERPGEGAGVDGEAACASSPGLSGGSTSHRSNTEVPTRAAST